MLYLAPPVGTRVFKKSKVRFKSFAPYAYKFFATLIFGFEKKKGIGTINTYKFYMHQIIAPPFRTHVCSTVSLSAQHCAKFLHWHVQPSISISSRWSIFCWPSSTTRKFPLNQEQFSGFSLKQLISINFSIVFICKTHPISEISALPRDYFMPDPAIPDVFGCF